MQSMRPHYSCMPSSTFIHAQSCILIYIGLAQACYASIQLDLYMHAATSGVYICYAYTSYIPSIIM